MPLDENFFADDCVNPFANFGDILSGDRFIGRTGWLRTVERRVLNEGNLEIVGIPRIGKSSLIYQKIMEHKQKLVEEKYLPIWIDVAVHDDSRIFFRSLVTECVNELRANGYLTETIESASVDALKEDSTWIDSLKGIKEFFTKIRLIRVRVIFILDELDFARNLFKGKASAFQSLRQLASHPTWKVTFVTMSRRPIRDIEEQAQGGSTFYGIFQRRDLSMFDEKDMEEYYGLLATVGVLVTPLMKEKIDFYCGQHPYILEMLGYEIVEAFCGQGRRDIDVDVAARGIEQSLIDYYDQLTNLLREDEKLDKLLQILFGPVIHVKPTDVDELLKYGLIKVAGENYIAFSEHFQSFLHLIEWETDLWPLLQGTERKMRSMISEILEEEYGEGWPEKLEKAHPKLGSQGESGKNLFERCRETQQRAVQTWGSRAPQNLLDYTYTKELFEIITKEWRLFRPIFGKEKKYWDDRAALVAKVRNPLAHNWDNVMKEHEKDIAEGYCKETLSVIEVYYSRSSGNGNAEHTGHVSS